MLEQETGRRAEHRPQPARPDSSRSRLVEPQQHERRRERQRDRRVQQRYEKIRSNKPLPRCGSGPTLRRGANIRLSPPEQFQKVVTGFVWMHMRSWNRQCGRNRVSAPAFQEPRRFQMAETVLLTDHTAIRDWAAARSGFPAIVDVSPEGGTQPMLRLVFDQQAYQDQDRRRTAGQRRRLRTGRMGRMVQAVRREQAWRWSSARTFPAGATVSTRSCGARLGAFPRKVADADSHAPAFRN